jgi:hypothetical protein
MIHITSITRGYNSYADRERAIKQLQKRGFDHFVRYKDTASEFALCYGRYEQPAKAR